MKKTIAWTAVLSLFLTAGCEGQTAGSGVAESPIDANVPQSRDFDAYMKRDLAAFLCKGAHDCRVEYQMLREGPTQTGISYPKFYVWAVCFQQDKVLTQGAARIAAINRQGFSVTNFFSRKDILDSPQEVGGIFPTPLVPKILQRAHD